MHEPVSVDILEQMPQKTAWKRCPYMSHYMHCLAGGFANMDCYDEKFHGICGHKKKADSKGDTPDEKTGGE